MKKRDKFPRLMGKLLIGISALLVVVVAWFGVNAFASANRTPVSSAMQKATAYPHDTITFSTQRDTPVAGATRVDIALKDFSITASITTFHVGTPYYFVATNKGPSVHEFTIVQALPDGKPLPNGGENAYQLFEIEQIAPGTSVSMNYTFTPRNEGAYEIDCLMRGHYMAGMRLPVTITK